MTAITLGLSTGATPAGWLDTTLTKGAPSSTNGSSATFVLQNDGATNVSRSLFAAPDIASVIGAGSVINSAVFRIRRNNVGGTGTARLYRLKKNPDYPTATWNNQATGVPWETAGALGASDFDSTVLATLVVVSTASGQDLDFSGAGFTSLVQGWVNGSIANNGMLLATDSGYNTTAEYRSGDHATAAQRPMLIIDYTPSIPPTLSVSDPLVSRLSGTATFTITASATFGTDITVDYATADVTATAGVDYVAKTGTATILAGQTTANVVVDILP